jgi:hypothetical protein
MQLSLISSNLRAARSATASELNVQGLQLEFATGNNLTLAAQQSELQANLTVVHSGTGVLEGRWQLAEPGSTEGRPLYRTLALLRKNLDNSQRSVLSSPLLPTNRAGRYLLRFCVTNRDMIADSMTVDGQCPIDNLIIQASYQVQGATQTMLGNILGLSPNQQAADEQTPFSWQAVSGAKVYQMQIFELTTADADLPSSKISTELLEPRFVVGMLLPSDTTNVPLSELVRSKLHSGQRYLWRITAHDESGRLLASSDESNFSYQPGKKR